VPHRVLTNAKRSRVLVVIESQAAAQSVAMQQEVEAFPVNRRTVVPLRPTLDADANPRMPWDETLSGIAVHFDASKDFENGHPSEALLKRIRDSVGVYRHKRRLLMAGTLATAFAIASAMTTVVLRYLNTLERKKVAPGDVAWRNQLLQMPMALMDDASLAELRRRQLLRNIIFTTFINRRLRPQERALTEALTTFIHQNGNTACRPSLSGPRNSVSSIEIDDVRTRECF
jgi:hypothetical protein